MLLPLSLIAGNKKRHAACQIPAGKWESEKPPPLLGPVKKLIEKIVIHDFDEDDKPRVSARLPTLTVWFYRNCNLKKVISFDYSASSDSDFGPFSYDTFEKTVTEYKYDKRGNWIRKTCTEEIGSPVYSNDHEYGELVRSITYY